MSSQHGHRCEPLPVVQGANSGRRVPTGEGSLRCAHGAVLKRLWLRSSSEMLDQVQRAAAVLLMCRSEPKVLLCGKADRLQADPSTRMTDRDLLVRQACVDRSTNRRATKLLPKSVKLANVQLGAPGLQPPPLSTGAMLLACSTSKAPGHRPIYHQC